ncbi:MAG: hypothetical protein PHI41_08775 [Erysipelotrichaceae bacterium]|nr:hypothetical protein [Erysipelotrichaceae bacterium]MDD3808809.1 hypothetical protein [Erysipelotrichaceae bacterium]
MKIVRLALVIVALALGIIFINQFHQTSQENALHALEQSINDKILLCYINEGRYPESLGYLEENYGLSFDKTRYQVFLIPIGENIIPDLTVFAYE